MARSPYEIRTEKEFKKNGFIADYKMRPTFVPKGYNVDYFGLFDHLFYNPITSELYLVQVKGHGDISKKYQKAFENFTINKVVKEIWAYKKNGKVRRITYH